MAAPEVCPATMREAGQATTHRVPLDSAGAADCMGWSLVSMAGSLGDIGGECKHFLAFMTGVCGKMGG